MDYQVLYLYPVPALLAATLLDRKTMVIPNHLTLPFIPLGLCITLCLGSRVFFYQCTGTVALLFLAGLIGLCGLGDLKLLMVVASTAGFFPTAAALCGGAMLMLLYCLCRRRDSLKKEWLSMMVAVRGGIPIDRTGEKLPFAGFLFAGYAAALLWEVFA